CFTVCVCRVHDGAMVTRLVVAAARVPETPWYVCKTNDGHWFYFNRGQGRSVWEPPDELATFQPDAFAAAMPHAFVWRTEPPRRSPSLGPVDEPAAAEPAA